MDAGGGVDKLDKVDEGEVEVGSLSKQWGHDPSNIIISTILVLYTSPHPKIHSSIPPNTIQSTCSTTVLHTPLT